MKQFSLSLRYFSIVMLCIGGGLFVLKWYELRQQKIAFENMNGVSAEERVETTPVPTELVDRVSKTGEENRETSVPQEVPLMKSETSALGDLTNGQVEKKNIPFVVQAPNGEWNNPIFQDGCEEASILMAAHFGDTISISSESARREIISIAELSKQVFGVSADTSAEDTLTLYRKYTGRADGSILDPATDENLREALMAGDILIVPVDGQMLGNPHFTAPGPRTHMIVVIGYDSDSQEYITNDPGTRFGAGYRYEASQLLNAMRDYPTGNHLPITSRAKRAIVLGKGAVSQ